MKFHASLPPAQARRIVPGVPCAILCLCRRSLAASGPAKVVGLASASEWTADRPTDFGGPAAIGEATDGDGDENSSREQRPNL